MMKIENFLSACEAMAPRALALDFDNPGLLVGPDHDEIHKVLVALDCTEAVAREAVNWGADLVLTHHPMFFSGIKRFTPCDPGTSAAYILARNGIGLFAAHTNLDAAQGGVNDALCGALGVINTRVIGNEGIARIGTLSESTTLRGFAAHVQERLGGRVRIAGAPDAAVARVAVMGGSGGNDVKLVRNEGADVYVTGEIKHSQAIEAIHLGLAVIEAGHYETERVVLPSVIYRLQTLTDGVQYKLACYDASPFWSL